MDFASTTDASHFFSWIRPYPCNRSRPLQATLLTFIGRFKYKLLWHLSFYKISTLQMVLADHNDHLTVARILLNSDTTKLQLGLTISSLPVVNHNFTGKISLNINNITFHQFI